MPSWPAMNPSSARALVCASAILVVLGPIATSHAAAFAGPFLAAVVSLFPAAFGRRRARLAASAVLALSVLVAVIHYPDYRRHMEQWAARAHAQAVEATDAPLKPKAAPVLR